MSSHSKFVITFYLTHGLVTVHPLRIFKAKKKDSIKKGGLWFIQEGGYAIKL